MYILVTAPRMAVQPHVRTYQMQMAGTSQGSVPVVKKKVELALSKANELRVGKQCYDYYCVFCHGRNGDGSGPVGQSYDVTPTDLRLPRVAAMSDGDLTAAMVKGIGHEPVLGYVVPEEYRPFLVAYVRTLSSTK